jgi:hypothetical protein
MFANELSELKRMTCAGGVQLSFIRFNSFHSLAKNPCPCPKARF